MMAEQYVDMRSLIKKPHHNYPRFIVDDSALQYPCNKPQIVVGDRSLQIDGIFSLFDLNVIILRWHTYNRLRVNFRKYPKEMTSRGDGKVFCKVRGFIGSQWMLVVAQISQLLLTLTCEVRPIHFGKGAPNPGFTLISAHQ